MNFKITSAESRSLIFRFLIVLLISFGMGLVLVYLKLLPVSNSSRHVYTLSIGISIWLLVEISELCFFYEQMRQLKSTWQRMSGRVLSLVFGFAIGVSIADKYSGYSFFIILVDDLDQLIGLILVTAIVATTTTSSLAYWRQAVTTRSLLSESHLRLLFSQLEPHMLFNTMGTLRALMEIDTPRAIDMMDALNSYLRATLKASRSNWHTLTEELDRIQDYLALMSIRMGTRLRYSIDYPIDLSAYLIPPLLLQPLVENAIKHGLEPSIEGGEIHIQVQKFGEHVLLTISDTGTGNLHSNLNLDSTGFGLSHVRERLDNIYLNRANLTIGYREGYTSTLQIRLPLNINHD